MLIILLLDETQDRIYAQASAPSCPASVLLARVSKGWRQAAAQQLQQHGASITLDLSRPSYDCFTLVDRPRLVSLAEWVQRYGHLLTGLYIKTSKPGQEEGLCPVGLDLEQKRLLEALVAASQQPGGPRLQQLQLPVVTQDPCLCLALSACKQLRQLQLDYVCSPAGTCVRNGDQQGAELAQLSQALQQLTQLTSLKLHLYGFSQEAHMSYGRLDTSITSGERATKVHLDGFYGRLPASLIVLHTSYMRHWKSGNPFPCEVYLHTTSLQHLVALQQLALPDNLQVTHPAGDASPNPLTALTALTYLRYAQALSLGAAVLALPNLVELCCPYPFGEAEPGHLVTLAAAAPGLRSLECHLGYEEEEEAADALEQLRQLTHLALQWGREAGSDSEEGSEEGSEKEEEEEEEVSAGGSSAAEGTASESEQFDSHDRASAAGRGAAAQRLAAAPGPAASCGASFAGSCSMQQQQQQQQAAGAAFQPLPLSQGVRGDVVSSLEGLKSLSLEPHVLEEVDIAALTSLTRLGVIFREAIQKCPAQRCRQLLQGLAPLGGQLQEVELRGLEVAKQAVCRAAAAAALGKVSLVLS